MNIKKILLVFALVFPFSFSFLFSEPVDVNHFLIAPSINGCGGFISNQSAYVLDGGKYSLGLHKFMLKFNYGFLDFMEAGAVIDFGISSAFVEIIKATAFNFKARFLDEADYFVSMAAGIEKLPVNLFENTAHNDFRLYAAASKKLGDWDLSLGVKKQLADKNFDLKNWGFAANVSKVISDTVLVMLEYDERTFNAGVKISFNANLSVDFFLKSIEKISQAGEMGNFLRNYFVFGITYLQ